MEPGPEVYRAGRSLTWHSLEKPPVILLGELRPMGKGKQGRILRGDVWDFQKGTFRRGTPTQLPVSFSADLVLGAQADHCLFYNLEGDTFL